MRPNRNAVAIALLLSLIVLVSACGEKATGLGPKEVWGKFMEALSTKNMMAIQGLADDDLTRQIARSGPADFANLIANHQSSQVREINIVAQDNKTARLEVNYKVSEEAEWATTFIVLMEKPKKNWRVTAVQGDVAMILPGFDM